MTVVAATNRPDMMDQVTIANTEAEFNQFLWDGTNEKVSGASETGKAW